MVVVVVVVVVDGVVVVVVVVFVVVLVIVVVVLVVDVVLVVLVVVSLSDPFPPIMFPSLSAHSRVSVSPPLLARQYVSLVLGSRSLSWPRHISLCRGFPSLTGKASRRPCLEVFTLGQGIPSPAPPTSSSQTQNIVKVTNINI